MLAPAARWFDPHLKKGATHDSSGLRTCDTYVAHESGYIHVKWPDEVMTSTPYPNSFLDPDTLSLDFPSIEPGVLARRKQAHAGPKTSKASKSEESTGDAKVRTLGVCTKLWLGAATVWSAV